MSKEYDDYINKHKINVEKGLLWLMDNCPELCNPLYSFQYSHDSSKYSKEEYEAYDAYFYGNKKSANVLNNFNYAWLHHIHNNPHHWQYWILFEDDPESGSPFKCLEMPYEYILEMVCDWWAFSWAADNLYEIFVWYEKHKKTIQLHPKTRKTVEDILNTIHAKLDESRGIL